MSPSSAQESTAGIGAIDHVELFVDNRDAAAEWYGRMFGFRVLESFRDWAQPAGGPLMISADGGRTKLALFAGPTPRERLPIGFRRLALRADAEAFARFVTSASEGAAQGARPRNGVMPPDVVDHDLALSVYFNDPWGHPLELTTYEADAARKLLRRP